MSGVGARRAIGLTGVIVGDVALANQQWEAAKSLHATNLAPEFEFNVLNVNLMAPPLAAPII
jgi:hypothetical protein